MRKSIAFFAICLMMAFASFGQSNQSVNVGDMFTIASVEGDNYQHLKFPRTNFIIKKGGIANYNNVVGQKVKVTAIKEKRGKKVATLVLASGKKFFNSHSSIKAHITEAIDTKELVKKNCCKK